MPRDTQKYDESKVKTLSSLEHIRLRPGMYVGRMGNGSHAEDGIYILLKEVIDNGIDEFIMGFGKKIVVEVEEQTGRVHYRISEADAAWDRLVADRRCPRCHGPATLS